MDFGVEVSEQSGIAVLNVRGEVDVATAPQFRQTLQELANQGQDRVVVDLDKVDFIDSAGLGVLVSGVKRLRSLDGDLLVVCTRQRTLDILELTRLNRAVDVHASVASAVGALASGN